MYAITGVTGHVGGAAARRLLGQGSRVRAVVRDAAKGRSWQEQGAEVGYADLGDRPALAEAFRGCEGAFVLLPTIPVATDVDAHHRGLADSIAGAVRDSGVPHVVLLSSIGADLAEGTGPVRWLHHLENRLRETDVRLTTLRPCHFQENVESVLGAVLEAGIYPVLGESADCPTWMVATSDVGDVVARSLRAAPAAGEVIDIVGPEYTQQQIADKLAAILDRPLQVTVIPQPGWADAMVGDGLPRELAQELAELQIATESGILQPRGDRQHRGVTEIDVTLRRLVPAMVRA